MSLLKRVRTSLGYWRRVLFSPRYRRNRKLHLRCERLDRSPVPRDLRLKQYAESLRAKIYSLSPIAINPVSEDEIHLLCGHSHTPLGCFALWSLLRYVQFDIAVFVHDDGSLDDADRQAWLSRFPNITIVSPLESREVQGKFFSVNNYPLLERMSRSHIYAKKLIDFHLFGSGRRLILLDTDVLFFRKPDELFRVLEKLKVESGIITTFDDDESSYVSDIQTVARLVGSIPELFNSGMCLLEKFSLTEFAEAEGILKLFSQHTPDLSGHPWVEQTIYAILAGRRTLYHMSSEYQMGGITGNPVAVHYSGPFRELFFTEGIPKL
jgi:hypothetical protein